VDSLTGEGLGLAFQQANALAEALANGDLTEYEVAHRRINRPPEMMSRLLLAMENRAWLRRRGLAALAKEPHLFERFLAVHAGIFSPLTFAGQRSVGGRIHRGGASSGSFQPALWFDICLRRFW
jgi:hypothetical protein